MAKSKFLQLLNSAVNTNPEELEKWIEEQINTKDENQRTFLHKASKAGNLPTVKYLIQIGAQIDAKDANEYTPLLAAVNGNNLEVVKYLIDNGALIDAGDVDGDTPLHIATYGQGPRNDFFVRGALIKRKMRFCLFSKNLLNKSPILRGARAPLARLGPRPL